MDLATVRVAMFLAKSPARLRSTTAIGLHTTSIGGTNQHHDGRGLAGSLASTLDGCGRTSAGIRALMPIAPPEYLAKGLSGPTRRQRICILHLRRWP